MIFQGSTEYIEKYDCAAEMFALQGYNCLEIDLRSQGLAHHLQADPNIGHVINFIFSSIMMFFLGSTEDIVGPPRILNRIARWPSARLEVIQDANHEIMMELPKLQSNFYGQTCAFFEGHHPIA